MIRIAQEKDIAIINNLGNSLINNFSKTYDVANYLKDKKYIILVNEEDIINAFAIILKNIDCYELEVIYVKEEYRKKGIATNIFNYFLKHYLQNNDIIFLEVAANNVNALNLYKKWGFTIIGTRKKYYEGMIDAKIMKKVIE